MGIFTKMFGWFNRKEASKGFQETPKVVQAPMLEKKEITIKKVVAKKKTVRKGK